MSRNITYEVLVQQGSRWEIHARHPSSKRDDAINEAKNLEKLPYISAVKVIKETYDPQEGVADESTVYKTGGGESGRGAARGTGPEPVRPRPVPSAAPAKKTGRRKPEKRTQQRKFAAARPLPIGRAPSSGIGIVAKIRRAPSSGIGIVAKMLLITLFSIATSSLVTGVSALFLRGFSALGYTLPQDIYGTTLFVIFAVTFLFSAVPMAMRYISMEDLESAEGDKSLNKPPARKAAKPVPPAPQQTKGPEEPAPAEDKPLPQEAKEAKEAKEAGEDDAAKGADDKEVETTDEPGDQESAEADVPLPPEIEKQNVYMMSFLSKALEHVKSSQPKIDNFNKFGINLFLAGACEALGNERGLTAEAAALVLGESVQVMGSRKEQATSFANKCDEYLLADARYMQIYQAGRNALNTFMGGDEEGARQLQAALVVWNKPKAKEAASGPITVLFTDMVGSTKLTQALGDAVAQQVVRTHNRIVRDALNQYAGKEVKHTGDGIMASFSTTSNGVEASMFIQRKTKSHNDSNPDLPLRLKIGINAGEPIAEDDDLFGTTVQLAARIVDKAKADQIFVSEIVRGICAGKEIKFKQLGGFDMKGFDQPVSLYEVIWEDGAPAPEAEQPTTGDAPGTAPADAQPQAAEQAPAMAAEATPESTPKAAPSPAEPAAAPTPGTSIPAAPPGVDASSAEPAAAPTPGTSIPAAPPGADAPPAAPAAAPTSGTSIPAAPPGTASESAVGPGPGQREHGGQRPEAAPQVAENKV